MKRLPKNKKNTSLTEKRDKELNESNIFYRHLAEFTPEAVVVHSQGKIVYANPAAVTLVEAKHKKEIIGQQVMKFIHPDSIQLIQERIGKMLSKGKVAPFVEEKFVSLKGTVISAETKAVPFTFQGKPAILAIIRDVTEKKQTEEDLKKSEERFRTLIQQSADAIQLLSKEGKILYTSDSIKKVLGYTADEIYGHPGKPYLHPEDMPMFMDKFHTLVATPGMRITLEYRVKHKNGSWAWIEATGVNHLDNPVIGAVVGNFRNITKRKEEEERQRFLEQVSTLLGESIEYKTTLQNICKLLVPYFADYIRIVLVNEANNREDVATYHSDPKKNILVKKLYTAYKDRTDTTHGVEHVLLSGKPEIMGVVSPKSARIVGNDKQIRQIISKLGLTSYMGIPLKIMDKVIGVITFSLAQKERSYTKADLQFAQEIARRIAYAVENAMLYNNLQKELHAKNLAQEEQAHLAALLDQTYDAILLWDFKGNIHYWNKGAEELYGYTKEEAIGKRVHTLLKTIHLTPYSKIEDTLLKNGRWEGELIHTAKDNKKFTVSCKKVLITEKDGSKHVLETNRDITQRIYLENSLKFLSDASKVLAASLEYKTTLRNVAKLAVPILADWCSVTIKNDNKIELLALVHIDHTKVRWARKLDKKYALDSNEKTGIANVLQTGKSEFYPVITDEMFVQAAKSEDQLDLFRKLQLCSAMIIPLKANNETIGALTAVSSESGRHFTKSDLAIAEELAARAGLAIENARLYSNAQKAISLRDEFISLASHELKTPITSLKMYAQALTRQFDKRGEGNLKQYFEKMDQQTNKLALLINDLLNVSKIQHGKLEFNTEYIDLNTIVKDTVEAVQETTKKHTIIVEGELKRKVYADPYRIYQVVTNLLTNAIKYSPNADTIHVRLTAEKSVAVVTVEDYGIGIEKDQQKKIFNQFYRVTNHEEKTFPGLGMGLFISHEIVLRHGGNMSVVSAKGKGSQFSFTLPYTNENFSSLKPSIEYALKE